MSEPETFESSPDVDASRTNPSGQTAEYRAYLLRLWRGGPDTGWRGSLQSAQSGERHMFADVESLVAFLRGQLVG